MSALTADQLAKLGNFDRSTIDNLTSDINAGQAVDAVSASGACDLTRVRTELSVDGTKAYTLAAPTAPNQVKIITCVAATNTPLGTLTVSSPDNVTGFVCASTFVFDTVGQELELTATAALKWRCVRKKRAGGTANNVIVGTTVLTGFSMWALYGASVTNTVSSTGTSALPNGSAVGERCVVINTAVSGTPVGNIDGVYVGMTGAAYTHMGTIGVASSTTVTGDFASLVWNGSSWLVDNMSGITWS